jgi:hypothetical protein
MTKISMIKNKTGQAQKSECSRLQDSNVECNLKWLKPQLARFFVLNFKHSYFDIVSDFVF